MIDLGDEASFFLVSILYILNTRSLQLRSLFSVCFWTDKFHLVRYISIYILHLVRYFSISNNRFDLTVNLYITFNDIIESN